MLYPVELRAQIVAHQWLTASCLSAFPISTLPVAAAARVSERFGGRKVLRKTSICQSPVRGLAFRKQPEILGEATFLPPTFRI